MLSAQEQPPAYFAAARAPFYDFALADSGSDVHMCPEDFGKDGKFVDAGAGSRLFDVQGKEIATQGVLTSSVRFSGCTKPQRLRRKAA